MSITQKNIIYKMLKPTKCKRCVLSTNCVLFAVKNEQELLLYYLILFVFSSDNEILYRYSQKYNHNEEFNRFLEDDSEPDLFYQLVVIPIVFIIVWIALMLCFPGALCMSMGTTLLPFGGIGIICQGIGAILMAPMFLIFFLGIAYGDSFDPIKDGEDEDSSSTFNVGSLLMSLSSLYNMTDVPGNVFFNIDKP